MRIAALFCGLVAGLFALLAPVGLDIDLLSPFLKLWGSTPSEQLLGTVAWYAPPTLAIIAGLLATFAPSLGGALLLIAVAGWVGFGLVDPSFFRLELLAPAALSLVGALLAMVGGEIDRRRRRAARRGGRDMLRENDALEDDAEEQAREAAFAMDPLTVTREEAPPRPTREIPLTLEDVVPVEPEPRRSRTESIWPEPPVRRPILERDTEPELTPRASLFERPVARVDRPSRQDRREPPRYEDSPRPGRNAFVWLVALNGLLLLGLAAAVGYVLIDRQSSETSAVAADAGPASPVAATQPAMQVPAVADPDQRLTPNVWPALAEPGAPIPVLQLPASGEEDPPGGEPASQIAEATVAAASGFADPFAYCDAVKTIDYVDSRYTGPRLTAAITEALRVPPASAPDRVSWRCVDGTVYACASFDWPVCAMTPTAQEMLEYCKRNPGAPRLFAPNGTWSCEGGNPKLPEDASWPVDDRGFFPNAWIPVLPPPRTAGQ